MVAFLFNFSNPNGIALFPEGFSQAADLQIPARFVRDLVTEGDALVVSFSTITSAMHLAAYMGARNIILVGHDCGTIDGKLKFEGYPVPEFQEVNKDFYRNFLQNIEPQTKLVRDQLQTVYECRVYSLNPWVNVGLEGHVWRR